MARENSTTSIRVVIDNEGGFSDHPSDPGGRTNYGITQATLERARKLGMAGLPNDVADLSQRQAECIYQRLYWAEAGCHEMPLGFDLAVLDAAVNHGVQRAVKMLQRALNAVIRQEQIPREALEPLAEDGLWGPKTKNALAELKGDVREDAQLLREFHLRRFLTWSGLNKAAFEKGWFRRGLKMLQESTYLAIDGTMLYRAKINNDPVKFE